MGRHRHPYIARPCAKCSTTVPPERRSDAIYCSPQCGGAAEKARYVATHPEYQARQRVLIQRLRHLKEHGHTDFITNPVGNPKDRFRVARSLGYRSMLEVNVARQLEAAGIPFLYESVKLTYTCHPPATPEELGS